MEKLVLVEGTFTAEESHEILANIFKAKMNFHKMKNFSHQERMGTGDAHSLKRIPELQASLDKVIALTAEAKALNKTLTISSEIIITLNDE